VFQKRALISRSGCATQVPVLLCESIMKSR
jgi:hypothetical protein